MAISNLSDFKIYNEELQGGFIERLTQKADVFNEGSSGTIRLVTDDMLGYYKKEAFWKSIGDGIIRRQDTTANTAVTPRKLEQNEKVDVKLFRLIEPVDVSYNSFAEIGGDADGDASFILGQMIADRMIREMLNTVLTGLVAAVPASLTNDVTAATVQSVTHQNILRTLAKFGDNSDRIKAFVMHSSTWFDLLEQGLDDGYEHVSQDILNVYFVPTFGRRVIVTDSPAFLNATPTPDVYTVLGLQEDAGVISRIGDVKMASQQVLGNEQLALRIQGEYRYNIGIKGFAYDSTNGGINPADAAIATATNWDKCVTSDYDTAGVALKVEPKA
jgi:hypothetical protein